MREFEEEIFQGNWSKADCSNCESLDNLISQLKCYSYSGKLNLQLWKRLNHGLKTISHIQQAEDYLHLPMDLDTRNQIQEVKNVIKMRSEIEDVVRDLAVALLGASIKIEYPENIQQKINKQHKFIETGK